MATIKYCSWATGDDTTGDGSAGNPYKTITKASTGLTDGDEVRVAKSPEPTNLTGTLSFTNNSTAVTGSGTLFTTELAIGDFVLGGDGYWWEVVTITSDTDAELYKVYSGDTQSGVSSQKLGVTDTGAAASSSTQVQVVSSSGTSSANLKFSGGWDLTTETQTGQTFFRQLNVTTFTNRYGYGLYAESKNYFELSKLNFLRYNAGVYFKLCALFSMMPIICNSNYTGIINEGSMSFQLISPICDSNADTGVYSAGSKNFIVVSPICDSNGNYGIYNHNDTIDYTYISPTCRSNARGFASTNADGKILGALTTSGNDYAIQSYYWGNLLIAKANISENNKLILFGSNYINKRVSIGDMGGQSYIYTDGGNIVSQDATAGGTGKEWKFSVTSNIRGANYHLDQEIARVLVAANKQVTVKLYFKKSNASAIKGGLFMRGLQIAGVDDDILVECPADTNRNQVTLTFTPTEAGVVSIEAHAWYVSSTTDYVIVDDIDITQAD